MSSSTVCHTQPVDAGNTSNIDHAHLTVATSRRLAPPTQAKLCAIGERCATVGGVAKCMQNLGESSSLRCFVILLDTTALGLLVGSALFGATKTAIVQAIGSVAQMDAVVNACLH
ncbi:hypothetical protein NECAME_16875 [Necator americanus]|uniref:Uncharacterized protein n=1 Tax=Necator americanus TaxID=51031 RepID=W2TTS4_NECAM|nr:hypothetical protein NECAME_16875 [Necator americanus]ETN85188.1 hypothetical protein NECAME_16875 [Necator americanus]